MSGFTAADVPDQSGKCIIVTGANTGIGFEAAKVLAGKGARVLLACRDEGKAQAAMSAIRDAAPNANLAFLPLDQADLASVRRGVELAVEEPRIDVLLNNAGVMFPPLTRTKDGFELQLGVNHLGTFALTGLLLPKLAETPGSPGGCAPSPLRPCPCRGRRGGHGRLSRPAPWPPRSRCRCWRR